MPEQRDIVPRGTPLAQRSFSLRELLVGVGVAFVGGLLLGHGLGSKTTDVSQPTHVENLGGANRVSAPTKTPPQAAKPQRPAPPPSNWTYTTVPDAMRDEPVKIACTTSLNEVNLSPPYESVTADLCIRQRSKDGLNIWVRLNGNGQFICTSYSACNVSVRFGNDPAERYSALEPSDNSSNQVFLLSAARVLAGVKRASETLVEAEFYEAGTQTMRFNTSGLVWPPKR